MKRVFCLVLLFLIINTVICFSQNSDLKYYSSIQDGDYDNNFNGLAVAIFLGDSTEVDDEMIEELKNKLPKNTRDILKLSRNNVWLCKKGFK